MYGSVLTPENMVYFAGAFYVAGMAITNQIILRLLILAGTCVYLIYYAIIGESPLWEAIYVSLLIGIANIGGLSTLIARQSRLAIPRAHADIFYDFPRLPPGDFRALMKLAKRYTVEQDKQVTLEGEMGEKLYFVLKGATLVRKGEQAFVLPPKLFLGEVSFLTGVPSSASAWLEEGAEVLEWQFDDLRRKCARNPRFNLALEAAISLDLAGKVARSMGESSVHVDSIPAPMINALSDVRRV
ncbi:Crp/Fnr family transcriptional regulator [Roseobacter litoralis]|uniref:Crp/Fnr family transcriptional regulator n=1 Tax=Roseobacter litoralis TaxID=42443 RepID=UPI0024931AC2|nr:cyclic nucleotide-binding domain-containing protein [Roseobacter litoralis]